MTDTIIQVNNLGKQYLIQHQTRERYQALRDVLSKNAITLAKKVLSPLTSEKKDASHELFWALKDVNFEVKQGEVIGIIGRNGAGKSTLLKLLSRITEPTTGRIRIKGRVASLLEVGTGFHPELSGRENIFLNGAILGMSKAEIKRKFDEIVAFAEVEKFLDTPVKRFSSGMYVRLAFAVAAHLEPEILLVDEVLAVGDEAFQKKCLGKMSEVAHEGRTVLYVSHNMGAINNLCQQSIVLGNGEIIYRGEAGDAVRFYLQNLNDQHMKEKHTGLVNFDRDDTKPIQFLQIGMKSSSDEFRSVFEYQETPLVHMQFDLRTPNPDYYAVLFIHDIYGHMIFFTADDDLNASSLPGLDAGQYSYQVQLPGHLLKPGQYYLTASLTKRNKSAGPIDRHDSILTFQITDNQSIRSARNGYRKPAIVAPEIPWELIEHKIKTN